MSLCEHGKVLCCEATELQGISGGAKSRHEPESWIEIFRQ